MIDHHARSGSVPGTDDRATRVADLRRRVQTGEYRVDPGAVAGALLRRLRTSGVGREVPSEDRGAARAAGDDDGGRLVAA